MQHDKQPINNVLVLCVIQLQYIDLARAVKVVDNARQAVETLKGKYKFKPYLH